MPLLTNSATNCQNSTCVRWLRIVIFGSPFMLSLRHGLVPGAGAALHARRYCGGKAGVGFGPSGNSFAIPTKDYNIKTLPFMKVSGYVKGFLEYAQSHPDLEFGYCHWLRPRWLS